MLASPSAGAFCNAVYRRLTAGRRELKPSRRIISYTLNGKPVSLAFDKEVSKRTGVQIAFLCHELPTLLRG